MYIVRKYIIYLYIVFILQCQKAQKLPNSQRRAETSVVLTVSDGVLCDVQAYIVIISYCHST